MEHAAPNSTARHTWQEYRSWGNEERWELIDGVAYAMTPAPSARHQWISGRLFGQLSRYFQGKACEPFSAPADVKLSAHDVVQPDLFIVCDKTQIKESHIEGPPALIVEILSPSSVAHDRARKMALYARSCVKEVWLVTPHPPIVEVYVLDGESYRVAEACSERDRLESRTFPGLIIELSEVFTFPVEPEQGITVVKEGTPPPYGRRAGQ
ncbi:MAG: Uma2 family endonuclease [Kiritimatiellae bacterium]|nr:Uma2 family endonuclease [Kiritimatiellia bacterium]